MYLTIPTLLVCTLFCILPAIPASPYNLHYTCYSPFFLLPSGDYWAIGTYDKCFYPLVFFFGSTQSLSQQSETRISLADQEVHLGTHSNA